MGTLWYLFWQAVGILLCRRIFADKRWSVRLWLGSVTGTVLSMWVPIPFSFIYGFGTLSHVFAAIAGLVLTVALLVLLRKKPAALSDSSCRADRPLVWLGLPFFVFWTFLVWSHTLQDVDGALYTGQCTYGDMSMHLGFITSLAVQQTFPPLYSILPGVPIAYPFLCDSVSSSMYVLGSGLNWSYILPMLFAFVQFACGFWFLAREICRSEKGPVLSFLLFFLNGGLGMIYFIKDYTLHDLFTGFYKTPTNLVEKQMRWVNVIADMLLPQRATLFGWAVLGAALWLLFRAVFRSDEKCWLPAGVLGGLLPMIHTHSFFALGLVAASWMAVSAFRDHFSKEWFSGWLRFGLTAVALAIPQLLIWTFRSVTGNEHFLRLNFDWVNGGRENWFWFWFRNVGPVFLITPAALIFGDREQRQIFSGAVTIFVICEFLVFQPNVYDDNKLLYVAYFFACFVSSDAVLNWLDSLKSERSRRVIAALFLILALNAGVFTLIREFLSGIPKYGYELFSADEVSAAEYIKENAPPDAVFLTDDNHDNAIAVLTGRNIVCGSASYLYFHGVDYQGQQKKAERMLTDPNVFEQYKDDLNVDFVYMGYYENAMSGNISGYLAENYPVVFSRRGITVYDVR